jgi:hypothetical protein
MTSPRLRSRQQSWISGAAVLASLAAAACNGGTHAAPFDGGTGQGGSGGAPEASAPEVSVDERVTPDAPTPCPETPTPLRTSGVTLTLSLAPVLAGKPFVFGEPNPLPSGQTVMPLNFRFYVSHVSLLTATGVPVPVDLVTASGAVEPFGVHLYVAGDAASSVLRVLAPAGTYTAISFMLGIDDACNSGSIARDAPLGTMSQMTWPPPAGYLFLRLEQQFGAGNAGASDAGASDAGAGAGDASTSDAAGSPSLPGAIHMGGSPGHFFAPMVTARGALTLAAGAPSSRSLSVQVDAIFEGATAAADPASLAMVLPFPEVQAGERLRQHAPALPLFVLAP